MPSPFPGVDPYVEGQRFKGFHASMLPAIRDLLVPALRPRYVVDVEEYVYVAKDDSSVVRAFAPDVMISESDAGWRESQTEHARGNLSVAPVTRQLVMPTKIRQLYLAIRDREGQGVVTVIELLSPWNKISEGRSDYLNKRENIFATPANLVEIDLLRGGTRIETSEPLPPGDYYAIVCRPALLPEVEIFPWHLRDRIPTIPIPLAEGEPDYLLDLQAAFDNVYDRAGYDYVLKYDKRLTPPVSKEDAQWIAERLSAAGKKLD